MKATDKIAALEWYAAVLRHREGRVLVRRALDGTETVTQLDPVEVYGNGEHRGRFVVRLRDTRVWRYAGGFCAIAESVSVARAMLRECAR